MTRKQTLTRTRTVYYAGVCLGKVGETCLPKRKPKVVSHEVVLYHNNGSQVWYGQDNTNGTYMYDGRVQR